MGFKKMRTGISVDMDDIDFLADLGIFGNTSDDIRFAIKLMRLYSIPVLKTIKKEM
ncbi:MAG TPA: hypothetical protein VF172_12465 [Nitrososphaera sp.]|jgi:hypothetical protein